MIRTDSEYKDALRRIKAERKSLADHRAKLQAMGFSAEEVSVGMAALQTFHLQFVEEVEQYTRIKRKDLGCFNALRNLGQILVGARIANGMSGRSLAQKLGVNESQVSRDERNEYSGITIERACSILDALGVDVSIECRLRPVSCEIKKDYVFETLPQKRYNDIEFEKVSHAAPLGKPPRAAA